MYDATGTATCTNASSTTNYLLGDLFETDGGGSITSSYQDGPSGDLASFNGPPTAASTVSYLYYDGHGDLAAESNSSGSRTASHSYDPFGAPLETPPANATSHRYVGRWDKQFDSTSNLILMGARPYDPSIGRFLSVDPVDGGSLNNYDYAGQDPINSYDLDGTMLSEGALDSIGGADPCDRQFCKSADSSWGQVASLGTVLHRLTGATTVAAVGLDLAALACTVATEGACAPLAYSALAANVTDAAVTNHFGTSSANFRRFGISVGMSIASAYGDVGLENFAKYLEKSGAGGGRVVRGIYGGIKVVLGRLVAP